MAAPREYPEEMRERAIRFSLDLVEGLEKLSINVACRRVGEHLGISSDTLRHWVKQTRVDAGKQPGVTTDERARLLELEREVRELRRANAILKSASAGVEKERVDADCAQVVRADRQDDDVAGPASPTSGLACRSTIRNLHFR